MRSRFCIPHCLSLVILAPLFAVGCVTPVGHWTGDDLKPEMARDQFPLLRAESAAGKFVSADLRIQQDGSYSAQLNYSGRIENVMGKWQTKENRVTFTDQGGNSWAYGMKKPDDNTLLLIKGIKGTDVTLTLKKVQ